MTQGEKAEPAMPKPRIFVSHINEEAPLAITLKSYLADDFLDFVEIFVSSDIESIAVGENWLASLDKALQEAFALLVLCSSASIDRPWVNFEVGAAWLKKIPIVPICHSGLPLTSLPIPFSLLEGIEAHSAEGLKKVYLLIAKQFGGKLPKTDFSKLIGEITQFEKGYEPQIRNKLKKIEEQKRSSAKDRFYEAFAKPDYTWRTVDRLKTLGGVTKEEAVKLLRKDPNVVLGKSRTGTLLARSLLRVGG